MSPALPSDFLASLTALLVAHVLADFLFQPGWMARGKRQSGTLLLHGLVVLILAQLAVGQFASPALALLALAHMLIDALKARLPAARGIGGFLADQAAHLLILILIAALVPDLWQAGWGRWPAAGAALPPALVAAGFLWAVRAGGFAVSLLMAGITTPPARSDAGAPREDLPIEDSATEGQPAEGQPKEGLPTEGLPAEGLPGGGQIIGWLERGLILALILAGEPGATGFLIAAKSILRFGTVNSGETAENRRISEYVIIGTLASFGWAILTGYGLVWLLGQLGAPR